MDCSSDSEEEHDGQAEHGSSVQQHHGTALPSHSKASAVPELNLCGITKAHAQERAYQSEKVDCLQSNEVTPPWRMPRPRHASDPGDGMVRQSIYQSMPTFRDFLSHAPLSESGIYEQLGLSRPFEPGQPAAASTTNAADEQAEQAAPDADAAPQRTAQHAERETAPSHDASRAKASAGAAAPVQQLGDISSAVQASPPLSATQLTFRDLLPPPPGEAAPPAALAAPTPSSVCSRPASHTLSRYPSSAELSTDYGSMPSAAATPPGVLTAAQPSAGLEQMCSTLFDTQHIDQQPESPCMSCVSPVAPGSILCQDGTVYEATNSGDAARSGSLSPPSMTPPMQVVPSRSAKAQRTCSPPSLDAPLLSQHGASAFMQAVQGADAMEVDCEVPTSSLPPVRHPQLDVASAFPSQLRFGQLPAIDEDKENGFVEPSTTEVLQPKASKQTTSRSWSGPLPGLPLQCITAAHVQQASAPAHAAAKQPAAQPAPQDTAAWRARHCGTLTPNAYLTDQLICDAITASHRCSGTGDASSSGSNNSSRRQSCGRRPLTPEDLEPLSCCVRPSSAPPPENEGPLLSNMPAVWARSHGCFGSDALQSTDVAVWPDLAWQPQRDTEPSPVRADAECAASVSLRMCT